MGSQLYFQNPLESTFVNNFTWFCRFSEFSALDKDVHAIFLWSECEGKDSC